MSRAVRSRPRARSGPEPRRGRSLFRGPLVFVVGLALLAVAGWIEGPQVARQVYALVGVRRVEAHAAILHEAARESGLDVHLLAGLVYVESRGRVDALSSAGAMGLFQLMPAAASDAAKRLRLPEPTAAELLSDARLSARLGANHLRQLHRSLGADPERVLVAYNAGRSRLLGWEREAGGWAAWRARHARAHDSPTLAYAEDVLRIAERFRERGVLAAGATLPGSSGLGAALPGASLPGTPPSAAESPVEGQPAERDPPAPDGGGIPGPVGPGAPARPDGGAGGPRAEAFSRSSGGNLGAASTVLHEAGPEGVPAGLSSRPGGRLSDGGVNLSTPADRPPALRGPRAPPR